jgi:hypothetical protein
MNRIEFLQNKYNHVEPVVFNTIVKYDPTNEKKYLDWLCRLYCNKKIAVNELPQIGSILNIFNNIKQQLNPDKKDIGRYSSVLELSLVITNFMFENRVSEDEYLKNGAKKIYESNDWLIIQPLTKEAAIQYGKTTKWCTSSIRDDENRFYSYMSSGTLYILINKKEPEKSSFKKVQLLVPIRHGVFEFKKANNTDVDINNFFRKNKILFDIMSNSVNGFDTTIMPYLISLIKEPTIEQQKKAIDYDTKNIKYIKKPIQIIQKYAMERNPEIIQYIEHPCDSVQEQYFKMSDAHGNFIKVLYERGLTPTPKVQKLAVQRNPKAIRHIPEPDQEVQMAAVLEDTSTIKHIERPTQKVQEAVVKNNVSYYTSIKQPSIKTKILALIEKPELAKKHISPTKEMVLKVAIKNEKILKYTSFKYSEKRKVGNSNKTTICNTIF